MALDDPLYNIYSNVSNLVEQFSVSNKSDNPQLFQDLEKLCGEIIKTYKAVKKNKNKKIIDYFPVCIDYVDSLMHSEGHATIFRDVTLQNLSDTLKETLSTAVTYLGTDYRLHFIYECQINVIKKGIRKIT